MPKPPVEWIEDDLLLLPLGENDSFERKGAPLLDLTLPQAKEGNVRNELAKQLSAFANTGGGQIIYGLTDTGDVDNGGIARFVRGRQPTKEWLESLIPTLTEFEILGVGVYEILPKANGALIAADKSIYVVDVPESERAPHQSKCDRKYYVRLGGTSQPASHRLIEDIRNRAHHPKLEVHDLRITSASSGNIAGLSGQLQTHVSVRLGLRNVGRVRATGGCLRVSSANPVTTGRFDNVDYFTRSGSEGTVLFELKNPLYPGMDICLQCSFNVFIDFRFDGRMRIGIGDSSFESALVVITSYADSAPPHKQEFKLGDVDPDKNMPKAVGEAFTRSFGKRPHDLSPGSPWQ